MYMLPQGNTLDTVPELGGKLTQWHIHDNLCFSPGEAPKVRGLTGEGRGLPSGARQARPRAHDPCVDRVAPLRPLRRPRGGSGAGRSRRARSGSATMRTVPDVI